MAPKAGEGLRGYRLLTELIAHSSEVHHCVVRERGNGCDIDKQNINFFYLNEVYTMTLTNQQLGVRDELVLGEPHCATNTTRKIKLNQQHTHIDGEIVNVQFSGAGPLRMRPETS
jgi:hypothetical protein